MTSLDKIREIIEQKRLWAKCGRGAGKMAPALAGRVVQAGGRRRLRLRRIWRSLRNQVRRRISSGCKRFGWLIGVSLWVAIGRQRAAGGGCGAAAAGPACRVVG